MIENPSVPPLVVLGAGVSGLSSAIELLERGYQVEIWTRDLPAATTSAVAGAVWFPFHAEPPELVAVWARETYDRLAELAADPSSGISMCEGILCDPELQDPSLWRDAVGPIRATVEGELPAGRKGEVFTVPIAEMPVYLDFLQSRFLALGGTLRLRTLSTMNEAFAETDRVVNCTGLDARELCGDAKVFSARGQVVRVSGVKVARWVLDPPGPDGVVSYIVPRFKKEEIVLGGTVEDYIEDRTPNPEVTQEILDRCTKLAPELSECRIVTPKVGLRPCRSSVRLEIEEVDERHAVIHNYGHGGSGLTLSWGCAREVADLADRRWGVGR
ncbi:MAG TPA: FAD-dependent oxidoreductase [Thermoanaerobaculia bacterium]|jgi:D-amino-acid oxidase|nr:FAD-dependent oxidoreductase [Thermoanaerobaculia bacterium]